MILIKKRQPRKWAGVPTSNTLPERIFKTKILDPLLEEFGFGKGRYVTNDAFKTRFTYYPFYPDFRLLDIPLIVEVDGIKWHYQKGKKKIEKDLAKNECYIGEGYFVFRATDKIIEKEIEIVISELRDYIKVIMNGKEQPRVKFCPEND